MELMGTIQNVAQLEGHFNFDAGDYNILINKPRINGVELVGNKTSADLHISGGGGGTSDYNDLTNKPKINGIGLIDNLTSHELELQDEINFSGDASQYLNGEGNFTTPPSGVISYSTSEQATGKKWIDGKDIYIKTIEPNITTTGTVTGDIKRGTINISNYIAGVDMAFIDIEHSYYEPVSEQTRGFISAHYEKDTGEIYFSTLYDRTNVPAKITIEYTKA